jgi:hypothetical protein
VARAVPLIVAEKAEWPPRTLSCGMSGRWLSGNEHSAELATGGFDDDDPVADVELQTLVCNRGNHPVRDVHCHRDGVGHDVT